MVGRAGGRRLSPSASLLRAPYGANNKTINKKTVALIAVNSPAATNKSKQWKQKRLKQTNKLGKERKAKTIFNKTQLSSLCG